MWQRDYRADRGHRSPRHYGISERKDMMPTPLLREETRVHSDLRPSEEVAKFFQGKNLVSITLIESSVALAEPSRRKRHGFSALLAGFDRKPIDVERRLCGMSIGKIESLSQTLSFLL
jgi:hypothetical protein